MKNLGDAQRKALIARHFGAAKCSYDEYAQIQSVVALELSQSLSFKKAPRILEIGCGTGFLTQHLLEKYPDGVFDITDISPEMVTRCSEKFDDGRCRYFTLDAENAELDCTYDLIVLSMTAQWFANTNKTLLHLAKFLNKGGELLYSTIGERSFYQWRDALEELSLPSGVVLQGQQQGIFKEEVYDINYGSTLNFLREMKRTGAALPREGYSRLTVEELRQACSLCDVSYGGTISWHILWGRIERP